MASVNKVILLGRLGGDPKFKQANGGIAICTFSVATSRRYKDRDGNRQEDTEWHNVTVFNRQAEVANQYLKKGSEVYIEGRLHTRTYDKDGQKHYVTEIVCESLQLGAKAKDGEQSPASRPTAAQDQSRSGRGSMDDINEDIPF